jgi:uncharacterized Zn-binding protein involved in type VI secretion
MSDFTLKPDPTIDIHAGSLLPIVRLGDTSSHGGAVTGSSTITTVEGIKQARSGDEFTCAISTHNPATVGPGFMSVAVDEGVDVAKNNDMTSCGATLIATQFVVFTESASIRITSPSNGASF